MMRIVKVVSGYYPHHPLADDLSEVDRGFPFISCGRWRAILPLNRCKLHRLLESARGPIWAISFRFVGLFLRAISGDVTSLMAVSAGLLGSR